MRVSSSEAIGLGQGQFIVHFVDGVLFLEELVVFALELLHDQGVTFHLLGFFVTRRA